MYEKDKITTDTHDCLADYFLPCSSRVSEVSCQKGYKQLPEGCENI